MQQCIERFLNKEKLKNTTEEDVECLCNLLDVVGPKLDQVDKGKLKKSMDEHFRSLSELCQKKYKLSSRFVFMIKDTLDCRAAKWKKRRESEGPKHMAEIRQEVEQKRKNEEARRILDNKHNRTSIHLHLSRAVMNIST